MPTAAFNAIGTPNTNTVPFKWTCPHCKQVAEITHGDFANNAWTIDLAKLRPHDCRIVEGVAIAPPNPDCRQPTIIIMFSAAYRSQPFATKVRSLRVVLLDRLRRSHFLNKFPRQSGKTSMRLGRSPILVRKRPQLSPAGRFRQ